MSLSATKAMAHFVGSSVKVGRCLSLCGAMLLGGLAATAAAGTLYIGTDTEEFGGATASYLAVATVNGANFVSEAKIPLNYPLNGIGDGPGFLYAGDPLTNTLRTIKYDGTLLTSVSAGFANNCCNEEMQFSAGKLYHAHYADVIQQIDPLTGAVIQSFAQPDVVGMALVGGQMWITHWAAHLVGKWDPATNTFTPVFSTPDNAGALAYDPDSGIIWVGQLGGMVIPYSLAGVAMNAGFDAVTPLGLVDGNGNPIPIDTVDGLTFQGEGRQIPEPGILALFGIAGLCGLARRKFFV